MTTLQECVATRFTEDIKAKQQAAEVLVGPTAQAAELLLACLMNDDRFLICGSGGSATDTQYFTAEITGRFEKEHMKLAAVTLTIDTSVLTVIGNNYSFEHIFSKQVHTLDRAGGVLVSISTSGNSANVIEAVKAVHEHDMRIIALTGRDGGRITTTLQDSDILPNVPYPRTVRIQENHILLIHAICDCISMMLLEGM